MSIITLNEQIIIIFGFWGLFSSLIYCQIKNKKGCMWLLLAALIVFLVSSLGFIINSFWYSEMARPSTLYKSSTYLIIGKAAYLIGIAVELGMILVYHLVKDRDLLTHERFRGYILQLSFLFVLAIIVHVYPAPIVAFLDNTGGELDSSNVRSLLIPVLTAVISGKFIEVTYDVYRCETHDWGP